MRTLSALLLLILLSALASAQTLPRRNLWVELRWVETQVSAAAVAGVRDGAVVLGTAGSVSPKGQVVLGTEKRSSDFQLLPRLLVLNGQTASVRLSETTAVQWLDYGVELDAATRGTPASGAKVYAAPRTITVGHSRGLSVSPRWPGGRQPVQVELRTELSQPGEAGASSQTQLVSTLQLPLGEWLTVARSGQSLQRQTGGTLSSRDAEVSSLRELQLRVDLAP